MITVDNVRIVWRRSVSSVSETRPAIGERALSAGEHVLLEVSDTATAVPRKIYRGFAMHLAGRGFVHFELIDPDTGVPIPVTDGAHGELVLTHLVPGDDPSITDEMWIEGARKHYDGPVVVARDLMEISL